MVGRARRRLQLPLGFRLRVITLNVNGIRSAAKKGLFRWLAAQKADVVCLQEMKCHEADLDAKLHGLKAFEILLRVRREEGLQRRRALQPQDARRGEAAASAVREFDAEGRYVEARFGKLWVISVYLPSGSAGPHRQASKFRFLKSFLAHLKKLKREGREIILCGDWNIAHKEIDLRNWRSNQKNSGFLPEERAWLTRVFDELGFVDVFRKLNAQARPVHLVVQPRPGLGEERRLAHRLPDRHAGHRGEGAKRVDLQDEAVLRPRAADDRL